MAFTHSSTKIRFPHVTYSRIGDGGIISVSRFIMGVGLLWGRNYFGPTGQMGLICRIWRGVLGKCVF
jgi:hypothetical protein